MYFEYICSTFARCLLDHVNGVLRCKLSVYATSAKSNQCWMIQNLQENPDHSFIRLLFFQLCQSVQKLLSKSIHNFQTILYETVRLKNITCFVDGICSYVVHCCLPSGHLIISLLINWLAVKGARWSVQLCFRVDANEAVITRQLHRIVARKQKTRLAKQSLIQSPDRFRNSAFAAASMSVCPQLAM